MKDDYAKWWMVFLVYILAIFNLIVTINILTVLSKMGY